MEAELAIAQERIDNAPGYTPEDAMEVMRKELDSIFVELNNLYDDDQDDNE